MRDDEVGEMRRLLDLAQRLGRPLEAAEQIHDRAHDQELRRQVPAEGVPAADHRAEEVHEHRPHRDDQQHRGDDRDRLGPVGDRAVEIVVDADERIEQRQRPEAHQRKLVGVDRIAHAERQEIVDQHVAGRRQPKSDDVVDVEAVEGGAVDAGDHVGQDDAQHEIHRRPDESADQVPERDVERRFQPLRYGHQELCGGDGADQEQRNLRKQRKLARLQAVVLAEHQRDEGRRGDEVPDPGERDVPLRPRHLHAAQARHQVVALADEQRGERAEDHAVDVYRAQPAEIGLQMAAEIVGEVEHAGQQHAHGRRDEQPEHAPIEPGSHASPVDQGIEVDAGEFASQCLRFSHSPSLAAQPSPHDLSTPGFRPRGRRPGFRS